MFNPFKPKMIIKINCINYNGLYSNNDITALVNKIKQEHGSTHTLVFEINVNF